MLSQQIKCDMDEDGPPCKRCRERNLSCKLNKSLQTLIDEESRSVPFCWVRIFRR